MDIGLIDKLSYKNYLQSLKLMVERMLVKTFLLQ